jgi:hypothetical protein
MIIKNESELNMGRPTAKADLITAAAANYVKLNILVSDLTEQELFTSFDFSHDEKKKEAHWKRDKNLRDIFIHLYEWHLLLLNWVSSNQDGNQKTESTQEKLCQNVRRPYHALRECKRDIIR